MSHPLHKAGVVEYYLQANHLSEQDFAPRMAIQCLKTLCREVPINEADQTYGQHILKLLENSLALLRDSSTH